MRSGRFNKLNLFLNSRRILTGAPFLTAKSEAHKEFTTDFFNLEKKKPAMEIAGMCLPLKPQKEKLTHTHKFGTLILCCQLTWIRHYGIQKKSALNNINS